MRLAQSILKRKFPSVDKPLKKGLWKMEAPGLFSEFYAIWRSALDTAYTINDVYQITLYLVTCKRSPKIK